MQKPRASTIGSSFSLENSQGGKECKEEERNTPVLLETFPPWLKRTHPGPSTIPKKNSALVIKGFYKYMQDTRNFFPAVASYLKGFSFNFYSTENFPHGFEKWVEEAANTQAEQLSKELQLDCVGSQTWHYTPYVIKTEACEVDSTQNGCWNATNCGDDPVTPVFSQYKRSEAGSPHAIDAVRTLGLRKHVLKENLGEKKRTKVNVDYEMATQPSGQRVGLAGLRLAQATYWICSNPRPLFYIANWLPSPVRVFSPVMLYLNYLVLTKYLSRMPVNQMDKLSALSTINKRFTLNLESYDSATSFSVLTNAANQCLSLPWLSTLQATVNAMLSK